jgi:hypothetical protein
MTYKAGHAFLDYAEQEDTEIERRLNELLEEMQKMKPDQQGACFNELRDRMTALMGRREELLKRFRRAAAQSPDLPSTSQH